MTLRGAIPQIVRYTFLCSAVAGAICCFVLARAEWLFGQDSATSIPAAVHLVPFAARYLDRLANWQPDRKFALLKRAVRLQPFDSEALIQLGVASEFEQHNPSEAEHYYLRAAAVNHMFLPKWTLANFYFRQDNPREFFRWATASLAITPYSPDPVFELIWRMSSDGDTLATLIPNRPRILLAYAWFLSNSNRNANIPAIVERLIVAVGRHDPHAWGRDDLLPVIEDRLLSAGDRDAALRVWNEQAEAGWIAYQSLSPASPITNGNFHLPLLRHGFDWTPLETPGVRIDSSQPSALLRIEFSGEEPEHCVILRQYLPVQPDSRYRFRWKASFQLADALSGLTWQLTGIGTDHTESSAASSDLSTTDSWFIRTPGVRTALLTLEYNRPLGQTRARGAVVLRNVSAALE